jgi:myo-inositol-1(or 4)-monophosphatase
MPYERELEVALLAAREAGRILLHHYERGTEAWEKAEDNPLTIADLESDRAIAARLRAAFPDDAILSEETVSDPARGANRRVWIVDPMDGTKEFTRKIPEFCVSIALAEAGVPVVGVILNPVAGMTIHAARGGGCFRDGAPVRVSQVSRLEDAVMIASRTEISRDKFAAHADWFKELRPVGSIAWKLACVAAGDADLNVSLAPKNEWDVAAGDCLVSEAGGLYVDFEGRRRVYNQADTLIETFMAAGPPALVKAFCEREQARAGAQSTGNAGR